MAVTTARRVHAQLTLQPITLTPPPLHKPRPSAHIPTPHPTPSRTPSHSIVSHPHRRDSSLLPFRRTVKLIKLCRTLHHRSKSSHLLGAPPLFGHSVLHSRFMSHDGPCSHGPHRWLCKPMHNHNQGLGSASEWLQSRNPGSGFVPHGLGIRTASQQTCDT